MNTNTSETKNNTPDDVLRQKIEERAYHIWLVSGGGHGDHELHWLQAEKELTETSKQEAEQRSDVRNLKKTGKA